MAKLNSALAVVLLLLIAHAETVAVQVAAKKAAHHVSNIARCLNGVFGSKAASPGVNTSQTHHSF